MGCKGPFDARFETAQSARRALSDYAIQNAQKRNFSKMGCSIFLPPIFRFFVICCKQMKTMKQKVMELRFD